MNATRLNSGFTLIEIAIVLLVVTIMLGYTVAMFPIQQELKQYRETNREMDRIIDHLIAFAQVNGRLPCPDTNAGGSVIDGQEDIVAGGCAAYFAFLPTVTLGMRGDIAANGNLLDAWGSGYGYHVSDVDFGNGNADLVVGGDIQAEGLTNVNPDLVVCDDSPALANDVACQAGTTTIINNAAVVIVSLGKDRGLVASNIQVENQDDFHDGTNDTVYTFSSQNAAAGTEYDDVVKWITRHFLFSKMIEADQLP